MKRLIVLVLLAAIQLSQAEESTNKLVYNAVKSNPIPAKPLQGYQSITQTLAAAKDTFALGFFTVPNCRYCQVQKQTLLQFYQRYGWKIKEINTMAHGALAEKFNVEVTPTLVIIKKNATGWMPLSVGVESLSTIEQKVFRAVRLFNKDCAAQMGTDEQSGVIAGAVS